VSAVQKGRVAAVQFHPEKSGAVGLKILRNFLDAATAPPPPRPPPPTTMAGRAALARTRFCRRVIACLDVRANDNGDLVVTKGDQYDVREASAGEKGEVRNLGKPVRLAQRYYEEGADEVTFLNITVRRAAARPPPRALRCEAARLSACARRGAGLPRLPAHRPADAASAGGGE